MGIFGCIGFFIDWNIWYISYVCCIGDCYFFYVVSNDFEVGIVNFDVVVFGELVRDRYIYVVFLVIFDQVWGYIEVLVSDSGGYVCYLQVGYLQFFLFNVQGVDLNRVLVLFFLLFIEVVCVELCGGIEFVLFFGQVDFEWFVQVKFIQVVVEKIKFFFWVMEVFWLVNDFVESSNKVGVVGMLNFYFYIEVGGVAMIVGELYFVEVVGVRVGNGMVGVQIVFLYVD